MAAIDRIKELLEQQLGATMQTAPADGSMWRRKRQADEAFIAQPIAQKEGQVSPKDGVTIQKPDISIDPNSDIPVAQHGPGGTSWSGEPIPRSEPTSDEGYVDASRPPIVPQIQPTEPNAVMQPTSTDMMARTQSPIGSPIQTLGGTTDGTTRPRVVP